MELRLALPGALVRRGKPWLLVSHSGRTERVRTPKTRGPGLDALEWLGGEVEALNVDGYVVSIYVLDPEEPCAVAVLEIADAGILQIIERKWLERYGVERRAANQP